MFKLSLPGITVQTGTYISRFITTGIYISHYVDIVYIVYQERSTHSECSKFHREISWELDMSWTILRNVHNTCRRGPHLCPCSPTLPKNKLVERTSGVGGPSYLLSMSTRLYIFL